MKTHAQILGEWKGNRIDYDNVYYYQCMDWIRLYSSLRDRDIPNHGNAIDLWYIGLGPKWKRITSSSFASPSEGDVVIWDESWGRGYGHIAIANRYCNPMTLRTVDQNAGSGNGDGLGKNAISSFFRSYTGVKGWYKYIG